MEYSFDRIQKIRFRVQDSLADKGKFLGGVECTLGQLVSTAPLRRQLAFDNGALVGKAHLTAVAEELNKDHDELWEFNFSAKNLDNKIPFLEMYKEDGGDSSWHLLHRTKVRRNRPNPTWPPFEMPLSRMTSRNFNCRFKLVVWDHDGNGDHDLIGEAVVELSELTPESTKPLEWPCVNLRKLAKVGTSYTSSGKIVLNGCNVRKQHTFLDYVFGGCQIGFVVGVDFTSSNGQPDDPTSLHRIDPQFPNEYLRAISAVGNVVQDYDSDKLFPAFGFGARIPPRVEASHGFALNFNDGNPFCEGVEGIVSAYRNCIPCIQFSEPTNIAPIIERVAEMAHKVHVKPNPTNYFILLILTDGVVSDMSQTRQAIVKASHLPMSIIIVGVGDADFSSMTLLDGDNWTLSSPDGTKSIRDIVQFVPFRKFHANHSLLAREVLAEVPRQMTDYFVLRKIPPDPPKFHISEVTAS